MDFLILQSATFSLSFFIIKTHFKEIVYRKWESKFLRLNQGGTLLAWDGSSIKHFHVSFY
jgi:hypothetical protein